MIFEATAVPDGTVHVQATWGALFMQHAVMTRETFDAWRELVENGYGIVEGPVENECLCAVPVGWVRERTGELSKGWEPREVG